MFKKILVPVDGSELAEQALKPALTLAANTNGQIFLLRIPILPASLTAVHAEFGTFPFEASLKEIQDDAQSYLNELVTRYHHPHVDLTPLIAEGDVAGTIVDTAVTHNVDLILMSTHGYSGVTRWLMGSIAEKVLRSAPLPVLIVRSAKPIRKLLITLDGSDLAEQALEPGLALATIFNAAPCLLRVEPERLVNPLEYAALEQAAVGLGEQLQESATAHAKNYLIEVTNNLSAQGVEVETAVLQGAAARNILDFAENEGFDLIVMATHGRTGLRRWVYGSVTERVLHGIRCDCAMLIVRVPDESLK